MSAKHYAGCDVCSIYNQAKNSSQGVFEAKKSCIETLLPSCSPKWGQKEFKLSTKPGKKTITRTIWTPREATKTSECWVVNKGVNIWHDKYSKPEAALFAWMEKQANLCPIINRLILKGKTTQLPKHCNKLLVVPKTIHITCNDGWLANAKRRWSTYILCSWRKRRCRSHNRAGGIANIQGFN